MSRWFFRLHLDSRLALLAGNHVQVSWRAEGPKLQLSVGAIGDGDVVEGDVFFALMQASKDQALYASGSGAFVSPLPVPWGVCASPSSLPGEQALLAAELALELWLVPSLELNDLDACRGALEARRATLREDVREALTYWLLCSTHPLDGRPDLKKSWRSDTDEVLVRRSLVWVGRRRPPEPLLAASQRLLEELTRLRLIASTLDSYEELIKAMAVLAPPLPDAFRQVIWWEAGYQLSARGLHQEADIAAQLYREACDRLTLRLPGLSKGGLPGFGVSVGQRAYYAGNFGVALLAYSKEWKSGSEQHRSRLKRLIANIFSDLGALGAAARLADEALAEQEVAGDPEVYKTLGRRGEIALRLGDAEGAAEYYRRSYDAQTELLGEKGAGGQTAVYRGHAALLAGHPDEAAGWYAEAHRADAEKDSRLNVYALMGEAALALRRNDHAAVLKCLVRLDGTEDKLIQGDELPRAIVILAGVAAGEPRERGVTAIQELLKHNYMAEALVLLPLVYRHARMVDKILNRIAEALRLWDKALLELPELAGDRVEGDLWPSVLLEAIAAVKKKDNLKPLVDLRKRIFPANFV